MINPQSYLATQLYSILKWGFHMNQIISNAARRLAMLHRVLSNADMPIEKILYILILRPAHRFASQIKANKAAAKIQNKVLHFIINIKGLTSFSQLGKDAGIASLQGRRMHARLFLFT